MMEELLMMQSSRVCTTIVTIVRTPRPGSPSMRPQAERYSTSLDALDLSPIFSFSRCSMKPSLREPSGSQRGTTKQETPSFVCASVTKASLMGAEVNHLCPVSQKASPGPSWPGCTGSARVVLLRTSEPPCFSVIDMPTVAPGLLLSGPSAPLYLQLCILASSSATQPWRSCSGRCCRSTGTAPKPMVRGQQAPGSSCVMRCSSAPRMTCAPARPSCSGCHAKAETPASTPSCSSWW
mmetsp:Transcript_48672/g.155520  ORF Transcript_48672/g.155520 Transcript_48672/m.155520 type:complete len:237 (-) Transcript_48672:96-806(-)